MNGVVAWAFGLAVAVTAVSTAQAMGEVRMPNGEYFEQTVDLSVKVRGGQVQIARTWTNGRWYLNPTWADLKFTLDSIDGSVMTIDRAGAVFERTGNGDSYLFDYDTFIQRTTSPAGWRWYDRLGNEVVYDAQGRVLRYADRNGVGVRFVRDAGGTITEIRDHANAVALTLTSSGGNVTSIRDRSGRTVSYTWSNGDLTRVTDALGNPWTYTYDGNGQILTATDAEGRTTTVTYVASFRVSGAAVPPGIGFSGRPGRDFRISRVAKLKDALGVETTYTYNYIKERRHWVVSEKRPVSATMDRTYDVEGRLVAIQDGTAVTFDRRKDGARVDFTKDERGLVTRREYDAYRKPIAVEHPDGTTERWTYDPRFSFPTEHINEVGTRSTWRYDDKGNLVERVEAAGAPEARTTRMTYTTFGEVATVTVAGATPAEDATTAYAYDAQGNVNQITDAESAITRFTHDVMGNALTTTDARGNVWNNTYDAVGRQLTAANPLGHTTTSQYDKVGNRTRSTDPTGNATVMTYDARDRLLTTTDPLGGVSTLTYDAEGRMLTYTDASGQRSTYAYDARGRLTSITDGAGNITRTEYGTTANGLDGLVAAMVYPTFREEYRYDNRNRRTQAIRVLPAETGQPERRETTTTAYDGRGNAIAQIDALGRTTQTAFDRLNREIEVTDPIGGKTRYTHDPRDNLLSLADANGNTHRFTFDKLDRTRTESRPMGQTIHYAYDATGNLTERIDPLNQRQVHTYDDANRRIRTEAFAAGAGAASRTITFTFDPRGLLTGYDDGTTSATYVYDPNGRRSSESVNFGAFSRTVGMSYTPSSRVAGISYTDGATVAYRYDGAGRLSELVHPGGVMQYSAYQWQRATRVELPGNLVRREGFDALQRSTRIEVGTIADPTAVMNHRYSYDPVGNITQKATRDGPTAYGYDALDRLTQATPPASTGLPSEGYTYDAVHNRQSSAHQPGPWAYNGNHELTQRGEGAVATSLAYDANGNLVREQRGGMVRTYRYDLFDRLIEVRDNDQPIARYAWDPFARRVQKEVITGGTSTIMWTLSIQRGVIAEYDASGTLMQDWQWEPDAPWSTGPIAQRMRDGVTMRSHQIHTDHLLTPVALTDAQGTVAWRARHEAFGTATVEANATASTPWRFPGQYADPETGLYWNLWRHYDPRTGRYSQSDPIGINGGINIYAYAAQSPGTYIDPTGQVFWFAAGCIAGVIAEVWDEFPKYQYDYRCYNFADLTAACVSGALPVGAAGFVWKAARPYWQYRHRTKIFDSADKIQRPTFSKYKQATQAKHVARLETERKRIAIAAILFVGDEALGDILEDHIRAEYDWYIESCPEECDD